MSLSFWPAHAETYDRQLFKLVRAGDTVEIRKLLLGGLDHDSAGHNVPIFLICRSGKRSLEAGKLLLSEGFHDVYNIADGFEGELNKDHHRSTLAGWRFDKRPWAQC